jgi:hypothetical protein
MLAASAFAQDVAAADALFNRGLADMDAGRYETACSAIAESQRLDPRPGTLFTLAVCEAQRGRIATAVTHYGDYLSLYERLAPAQKARQGKRPNEAKAQRQALLPQVPELTLVLPREAPARTEVHRDGVLVAKAALGVALPVDPGEHVLTTQAPGGPVWEQRLSLGKGEKKQLTLEVKPPPEQPAAKPAVAPVPEEKPAPQPDKASAGPSGRRVAVYVASGVGVIGLVLGGGMGVLTLKNKSEIDDHCGSGIKSPDETACDQAGLDAAKRAKPLSAVSTVGFAVGAAGVGAAVVLLLTEPARAKTAKTQSARWPTADVLQAGPAGAVVGVRGVW